MQTGRGSLYFGYGSNLDAEDLARYCAEKGLRSPLGRPVGRAWLPDHELRFHYRSRARGGGALDVAPRLGQLAEGFLFEVDAEGWATLDRKEGVPGSYARVEVHVLDGAQGVVAAQSYRVVPARREGFVAPMAEYLAVARRGRQRLGLGTTQLEAAARGEAPPFEVSALFVYGTLQRGEVLHGELGPGVDLASARRASAPGRLVDLGEYPGLLADPDPARRCRGERFGLGDVAGALARLDQVEGFRGHAPEASSLYHRVLATISTGEDDGARAPVERAFTYVLADPGAARRYPTIEDGDWRRHRRARSWHGA